MDRRAEPDAAHQRSRVRRNGQRVDALVPVVVTGEHRAARGALGRLATRQRCRADKRRDGGEEQAHAHRLRLDRGQAVPAVLDGWTLVRLGSRPVKELAPDLWMLGGFPPNGINIYLMGDVLVDAGTRHSGRRIFRQIPATRKRACAHPRASRPPGREQGCVRPARHRAVVRRARRRGDGEWQPRAGRPPAQQGHQGPVAGPPRRVDRRLREGDEIAGFRVLDVPGTRPATSPTGASPTGC